MSSKQLKLGFITSSLFCLGWATAWSISALQNTPSKNQQLRSLASVKSKSTIMMEKHLMPVHVEITPLAEIPEGPDDTITLKGTVRATFANFGHLIYTWILPSDVEVVKGSVTDTIASPVAGQDYDVEITLKNFDKQYRKELTLKATILDRDGMELVNTSVITSRPEDSMEHLAPLMMVKAQQELADKNRAPASVEEE